jgi:hypothetical protein
MRRIVAADGEVKTLVEAPRPLATQQERLRRRGWEPDQITKRILSQWPVAKKMELADRVVRTEGGVEVHAEQLRRVVPVWEMGSACAPTKGEFSVGVSGTSQAEAQIYPGRRTGTAWLPAEPAW